MNPLKIFARKKNDANEFFYDSSFNDYEPVVLKPKKPKRNLLKKMKRTVLEYRYSIKWPVVLLFEIVLNTDNILHLKYSEFLISTLCMFAITLIVYVQRKLNRI